MRAALPAIQAADPGAEVLIGAMSSRGQDLRARNSTLRPLVFLRALGCVDARWRRLRTGYCKGFKPATGDGFAFHPHGTLTSPDRAYPNRDDVNLASLGRLESALDRLQRGGRLRASTRRFGLYLDEYGYQTRPPDRTAGVSLATQDRWLQTRAYRAWRDPRVRLLTQYQWFDEPLRRAGSPFAGWQSGLRFLTGKREARARALRHADAARRRALAAVGPGAAGRRADGARRAAAAGREAVRAARDGAHRRARLLDAEAAAGAGRALPLQDRRSRRARASVAERRAALRPPRATPRWSVEQPLARSGG